MGVLADFTVTPSLVSVSSRILVTCHIVCRRMFHSLNGNLLTTVLRNFQSSCYRDVGRFRVADKILKRGPIKQSTRHEVSIQQVATPKKFFYGCGNSVMRSSLYNGSWLNCTSLSDPSHIVVVNEGCEMKSHLILKLDNNYVSRFAFH